MQLLKSLTLRGGSEENQRPLTFSPATINIFVGPNNSGKSLLLRELSHLIRENPRHNCRTVKAHIFNSLDDATKAALTSRLVYKPGKNHDQSPQFYYVGVRGVEQQVEKADFQSCLADLHRQQAHLWVLRYLCLSLDGSNRLTMLAAQNRGDLMQPPPGLLSGLFRNDGKRLEVRRIIHAAIGSYFITDATGSGNIRVRLSLVDPTPALERSFDDAALKFHDAAEPIENTSDGIRAFCGIIATVVESEPRIVFLDEPEAFLHPPLVVKLAKALCEKAKASEQQYFVATHSADFLMGCVQAGVDLNIVRMTYRDGLAAARLLPSEKIVPLMRNPLLRSTGVLDGLFYDSVIVTEADNDRSFYDEINHRLLSGKDETAGDDKQRNDSKGIPNCLFLNAQNWQTVGQIIRPLRELGVASAAVVDIDVVSAGDNTSFQNLLDAAGMPDGTRTALGQLRSGLKAHIVANKLEPKKKGVSALSGDHKADLENLIKQLAEYGVFLVPVGELECWLPQLTRPGGESWLVQTFQAMGENPDDPKYVKPGDDDVWAFMGSIRAWLHNPKRLGMPQ